MFYRILSPNESTLKIKKLGNKMYFEPGNKQKCL